MTPRALACCLTFALLVGSTALAAEASKAPQAKPSIQPASELYRRYAPELSAFKAALAKAYKKKAVLWVSDNHDRLELKVLVIYTDDGEEQLAAYQANIKKLAGQAFKKALATPRAQREIRNLTFEENTAYTRERLTGLSFKAW